MAAPPLLAVSSALCDRFQALSHVMDLVSSFLIPPTIDSAVYNDLQRVIQVYRHSRPYTVKAMDGAAGLGKLDLVQWLHANRTEGCSHAAFTNAAVNNHLNVLEWLYDVYPEMANPAQEIVTAAECGNVGIVEFLNCKVRREQMEQALDAAASRGQVAILKRFLGQDSYNVWKLLITGAADGQAQVVQFFMERGYNDKYRHVDPAMTNAILGGHSEVVEVLINWSDEYTIDDSLIFVADDGRQDMIRLLLEKGKPNMLGVAEALEKAAEDRQYEALKLLLDKFTSGESEKAGTMRLATFCVDRAFMSAVRNGRINVVKLLVGVFFEPYWRRTDRSSIQLSRGYLGFPCEGYQMKDESNNESVAVVAQATADNQNIEMAKLLAAKRKWLNTGYALRIAVEENHIDVLNVLVVESSSSSIQDALVRAAAFNREKVLEIILQHSNADTIEQALIQIESTGGSPLSKLLLARCDVGAYGRIFDKAARQGLVGLVQLLLVKMDRQSVRSAMISAAMTGETEVVKVLKEKGDSTGIKCAFEMAMVRGHVDVVELLRSQCDTDSIKFAMTTGDAEVVRLVRNKRPRLE